MGKKKSSELYWLVSHLLIQFMVFGIGVAIINPGLAIWFSFLNAVVHGVIDWNIWKLYKLSAYKRIKSEADQFTHLSQDDKNKWMAESGKNWQYWEDHWFYTTIGVDQFLHMSTLVILAVLMGLA